MKLRTICLIRLETICRIEAVSRRIGNARTRGHGSGSTAEDQIIEIVDGVSFELTKVESIFLSKNSTSKFYIEADQPFRKRLECKSQPMFPRQRSRPGSALPSFC